MRLTEHAKQRQVQRGIPQFAVDLLLEFGEIEYHRGRTIYHITKNSEKELKKYLGKFGADILKLVREIFGVTEGEYLITVARKNRHHKRNRT